MNNSRKKGRIIYAEKNISDLSIDYITNNYEK